MTRQIAFATCSNQPGVAANDAPVVEALADRNVAVTPIPWDKKEACWEDFSCVCLRSCWDYHERPEEFLDWLAALESRTQHVWNHPDIVRWNLRKTYLEDLHRIGVPIVDSLFIHQGQCVDLKSLVNARGWKEFVVKPLIGASGYHAWRGTAANAAALQKKLDSQIAAEAVIVQPFVQEIGDLGEWSLGYFGGRFSHAILKKPLQGEWRTQARFSPTMTLEEPPFQASGTAAQIFRHIDRQLLYARVDGVLIKNQFTLTELELIEPSFYLNRVPAERARTLAKNFANEIIKVI